MKMFQSLYKKNAYILWCFLFMLAYIGYAYYITHFILSIAYVKYLTFSMNLVAKGVVSYLLGSFVFFMVCIMIEAGFTAILLSLLRKFLIKRCTLRLDRENIYKFSSVCNILLNFIIAIGFVEESVIVERMAYDVEMNWIFCDVLVFKMLFEALFHKDALHKRFSKPEALPAEEVSEEPTEA